MASNRSAQATGFAAIPSIESLLQQPAGLALIEQHGRTLTLAALRSSVDEIRERLRQNSDIIVPGAAELVVAAAGRLEAFAAPRLRPVFNLTGTVLHTNLGRAPLPSAAVAAVAEVAGHPATVEYDLERAGRGDRDAVIEAWLCRLCGAEAATVVNNNAAALLLILNTLGLQREVPVSRGELVEIGGSFRLPDIMRSAGCELVEVGTTNRTHGHDFRSAINARTAMLLRVNTSNYEIQGYTASVSESDMATLAHEHDLPLVHDLGSGSLVDLTSLGISEEPLPGVSIRNGADIVCFSGDKLLGGPQCGLIIGRRDLIARMKSNPLKRALRCDKLTLAALQAVLPMYAKPEQALREIPALRLIHRSVSDIRATAERVLPALRESLPEMSVNIVDCASQIGSGALPTTHLPSLAVHVGAPAAIDTVSALPIATVAGLFRNLPRPVLGRLHDNGLWFDMRCLEQPEEHRFIDQLSQLVA